MTIIFKTYVIENSAGEYWSNEAGWVEKGFDVFSASEKETLCVPIDGFWVGYETGGAEK